MRKRLIPVSHACNIVLPFEISLMAASDLLQCHTQILLKQNRIHDMPAVKAALRHCIIIIIIAVHRLIMSGIIRIAQKRRIVRLLHRLSVNLLCKAPGTAKVIFHSGSADRRIFVISVNIKLHFSLAVPVPLQRRMCNIRSDIMSLSFYPVQHRIILLKLRQTLSAPLRMEVKQILRHFIHLPVIDLIEKAVKLRFMLVFQCNPCTLSKRHLEIAVHSPCRHNNDRKRIYNTVSRKSAAEEIAQRTFHRRCLFPVPVHPKHQITKHIIILFGTVRYRNPDMCDHSRSLDIRQCCNRTGWKLSKARRTFS